MSGVESKALLNPLSASSETHVQLDASTICMAVNILDIFMWLTSCGDCAFVRASIKYVSYHST